MQLVIASTSDHKYDEFRRIFLGSSVLLCVPKDLGSPIDVEESGDTFAANAALKATTYAQEYSSWAIADDSGIEIDALDGRPGIYSSRFAGLLATDTDRNEKVLHLLRHVADEARSARYRCAIAVADQAATIIYTTEATVEGKISRKPIGSGGFGYDPIFFLDGFNRTMAQLSNVEKDSISHRGKAGRSTRQHLESLLARTSLNTNGN